jgi:hypothetical protein
MPFERFGVAILLAANGAEIGVRVRMDVNHMLPLLVGAEKLLAIGTNRHWLLPPIFMVRSPLRMHSSDWCQYRVALMAQAWGTTSAVVLLI